MEHGDKPKYKNIPVELDTYDMVVVLCELHDMSKRSQGALVRKLAKAEYEVFEKLEKVPSWEVKKAEIKRKRLMEQKERTKGKKVSTQDLPKAD